MALSKDKIIKEFSDKSQDSQVLSAIGKDTNKILD